MASHRFTDCSHARAHASIAMHTLWRDGILVTMAARHRPLSPVRLRAIPDLGIILGDLRCGTWSLRGSAYWIICFPALSDRAQLLISVVQLLLHPDHVTFVVSARLYWPSKSSVIVSLGSAHPSSWRTISGTLTDGIDLLRTTITQHS